MKAEDTVKDCKPEDYSMRVMQARVSFKDGKEQGIAEGTKLCKEHYEEEVIPEVKRQTREDFVNELNHILDGTAHWRKLEVIEDYLKARKHDNS